MEGRTRKIDELLATLEEAGGDERRLDALRRARQFKRSWVDLAQSLVRIRSKNVHREWGYEDFHDYCSKELQLRRATVDKLTISYSTMQRHAPQVLQWDGVAHPIPSYQAIDYFKRAVEQQESSPSKRPQRKAVEDPVRELKSAVFNEGQTIGELRKRFDPILFPKTKATRRLESARQAGRLAQKLAQLLPDVDDLSDKRRRQVEALLGALRQELDEIVESLQERASKGARAKAPLKRDKSAS